MVTMMLMKDLSTFKNSLRSPFGKRMPNERVKPTIIGSPNLLPWEMKVRYPKKEVRHEDGISSTIITRAVGCLDFDLQGSGKLGGILP